MPSCLSARSHSSANGERISYSSKFFDFVGCKTDELHLECYFYRQLVKVLLLNKQSHFVSQTLVGRPSHLFLEHLAANWLMSVVSRDLQYPVSMTKIIHEQTTNGVTTQCVGIISGCRSMLHTKSGLGRTSLYTGMELCKQCALQNDHKVKLISFSWTLNWNPFSKCKPDDS